MLPNLKLSFDVGELEGQDEAFGAPVEEVEGGGNGHKEQPEPEEDEDLLIEEVDGQHTLHRVTVNVRLK